MMADELLVPERMGILLVISHSNPDEKVSPSLWQILMPLLK
jgi:hypothetical protein